MVSKPADADDFSGVIGEAQVKAGCTRRELEIVRWYVDLLQLPGISALVRRCVIEKAVQEWHRQGAPEVEIEI